MGLRRVMARRLRRTTTANWPIDPATAWTPTGWPGWPMGKKFAVVLTHDVEGPAGVARCRELAGHEEKLGFHSSFNFIPEGPYTVGDDLRAWLKEHGFEVGVHDLNHDGRLYSSAKEFERKAVRINHYLKEWGARGFRSGFMLRNLDWLHQLEIDYDCSTFDTDPFEPQPDGAGTIFPFWKSPLSPAGPQTPSGSSLSAPRSGLLSPSSAPGSQTPFPRPQTSATAQAGRPTPGGEPATSVPPLPTFRSASGPENVGQTQVPAGAGNRASPARRPGYVELPYTLPQDSTLFLLHQEKTNAIWRDKLDWVARHGGMVLINVHPDYLHMGGKGRLTVLDHYIDLLVYLQQKYADSYWHALPREMATFVHAWKAGKIPSNSIHD